MFPKEMGPPAIQYCCMQALSLLLSPRDPRVWEWDHAGLFVPEDLGSPSNNKFGEKNEISAKKWEK